MKEKLPITFGQILHVSDPERKGLQCCVQIWVVAMWFSFFTFSSPLCVSQLRSKLHLAPPLSRLALYKSHRRQVGNKVVYRFVFVPVLFSLTPLQLLSLFSGNILPSVYCLVNTLSVCLLTTELFLSLLFITSAFLSWNLLSLPFHLLCQWKCFNLGLNPVRGKKLELKACPSTISLYSLHGGSILDRDRVSNIFSYCKLLSNVCFDINEIQAFT